MRVAVIGAGIVGVTTAYELSQEGHEVTVFERRGSVAAEASFANAGVVAPGYVTPWAAPGVPGKVLRHLMRKHSPVRVSATLSPTTLRWMWRWWRACNGSDWEANRTNMQRLALFSRQRLHHLTHRLQLDYERGQGFLVLLRTAQDLAMAKPGLKLLAELGTRFHLVDAARCREIEPGLHPDTALHAGIHLEDDEVGNCREFAILMRGEAQRLGVQFRFHTQVLRLMPGLTPGVVHRHALPTDSTDRGPAADTAVHEGPHTRPMTCEPTADRFDAVVVCAAMGSSALLRPHGLDLPLLAVHGYSVTAPMRHHDNHPDLGPRSGLMDEHYKVAISRLGERIRVAGTAEVGGDPVHQRADMLDTLYKVLNDWYPAAPNLNQVQCWKGARPMLPDGPPLLGASGIDGIWLNLGHGSSGWALACGSASVLNDLVSGRSAAIDIRGLGVERLRL